MFAEGLRRRPSSIPQRDVVELDRGCGRTRKELANDLPPDRLGETPVKRRGKRPSALLGAMTVSGVDQSRVRVSEP